MSDIAVRVENLSKRYLIGERAAKPETLAATLLQTIQAPYKRFRSVLRNDAAFGQQREFWALQDVSFEVKRGEVVGIIGRNGAGKSTLLKILSQITAPTKGGVDIYGRLGTLLEVGTGFHPDLTGRENVFLNATILGMRQAEIRRKFDEIVDFSGIGDFIDTPVKRYSSGMYVRLAFAVAAHIDPDILIVDEVLAVGDADFQKKSLGKMSSVAEAGRTILFVSHNMAMINRICTKCALLNNGQLVDFGETDRIVDRYISLGNTASTVYEKPRDTTNAIDLRRVVMVGKNGEPQSDFRYDEPVTFQIDYEVNVVTANALVWVHLNTLLGDPVFVSADYDTDLEKYRVRQPGAYRAIFQVPSHLLNSLTYVPVIGITAAYDPYETFARIEMAPFTITDVGLMPPGESDHRIGVIKPFIKWETDRVSDLVAE